jgi:hypothetical protein
MQTIRIPKNLLFLSDKLPKPNYETKVNNSGELPEIRQINQRKKPKNKDNLQENLDNTNNIAEPQIASIKKKYTKEGSNIEGNNQLKNSINNNKINEEEGLGLPNKVNDKREKSPSG